MPLFSFQCECGKTFEVVLPKRSKTATCAECGGIAVNIYMPFNISYGISKVPAKGMFAAGLGKQVNDTFEYKREMDRAGYQEIDGKDADAINKQRIYNRNDDVKRATEEAKKYAKEQMQKGGLDKRSK